MSAFLAPFLSASSPETVSEHTFNAIARSHLVSRSFSRGPPPTAERRIAMRVTGDAPETGCVELRQAFGGQVLVHKGTGEHCRLEGQWEIDFQRGFAVLLRTDVGGGTSSLWANEILSKLSLLLARRPGSDAGEFVVLDRTTNVSEWRQSVYDSAAGARVARAIGLAGPPLEAFVSRLPRPHVSVRFGINRVIWHCLGNAMDGRWLGKQWPSFKSFAASIGYQDFHFARSAKSVKMKRLQSGSSADDLEEWADHDAEFSCSAIGVMSVLSQVLVGGKLKGRGVDSEARALLALNEFVATFGGADCEFQVFRERSELLGGVCFAGGKIARVKLNDPKLAEVLGDAGEGIVQVLMRCARIARRGSKAKAHPYAQAVLASFGECLLSSAECSPCGGLFNDLDHLDLEIVFREASSRPRRVPKEYNMLVNSEVARQPSLRNPQQFLAASAMHRGERSKKRGAPSSPKSRRGLRPAAGRLFCKSNMKQDLATVARDLGETRRGNLVVSPSPMGSSSHSLAFGVYSLWPPPGTAFALALFRTGASMRTADLRFHSSSIRRRNLPAHCAHKRDLRPGIRHLGSGV